VLDENGMVKEYYDYEPFGLSLRENITGNEQARYKFTGKELDDRNSLNWYDFGARYYDPTIGRFLSPDRFADMYPSLSPYQYAANNPVIFVDAHGDSIVHINLEQQKEMMEQMSKQDRRQYEEYVKSKIVYEFADVLQGWQVITEARSYIDLSYEWGGADLTKGVDCSGFVYGVLKKLGLIKGDKFNTSNMLGGSRKDKFESIKSNNILWGDIAKYEGHMGFYDPVPIKNPPEGSLNGATLLSARGNPKGTGLQKVHYGVLNSTKWYGIPIFYRIK